MKTTVQKMEQEDRDRYDNLSAGIRFKKGSPLMKFKDNIKKVESKYREDHVEYV